MGDIRIAIGNFMFRYRNTLFPVVLVLLYLVAVPPLTLFGSPALEMLKDVVAVAFAVAGLALRGTVIGLAYIKRGGVNKQIFADKLVTEGMFRTCRNPLYTGNMLIVIGLFLFHGHPLVFVPGILFFWFIYVCIIAAEEQYLRNRFGADYDAYCAEVPRWIPDFSCWSEATEGMSFSFKRVLIKDYGTIALTLSVLCLAELYEYVGNFNFAGAWNAYSGWVSALVVMVLLLAAAALTISRLKKAKLLREG